MGGMHVPTLRLKATSISLGVLAKAGIIFNRRLSFFLCPQKEQRTSRFTDGVVRNGGLEYPH